MSIRTVLYQWMFISFFFLATLCLQLLGVSREYFEKASSLKVDFIADELPTPTKAGGLHKVLPGRHRT